MRDAIAGVTCHQIISANILIGSDENGGQLFICYVSVCPAASTAVASSVLQGTCNDNVNSVSKGRIYHVAKRQI